MLDFPDAPSEGEIFSAGGAAWTWTSGKWVASATGLPSLAQGEVLGNPDAGDAPATAADLALMLRASLGDGTAGEVITAGGTGIDPAWAGLPAVPGLPVLAQGEVLGNPDATPAGAVAADLPLMLRAALGDGIAGQVITSSGTGVDPVWATLPVAPVAKYIIGAYAPAAPTASQVLLLHQVSRAVTIPSNFADHAGYASKARARVAATASTTINVQRATAAAPSTFTNVGTIVFAAGALTGTFSTSGTAVNYAVGDTLALVAPATPDTTLAGFSATLVLSET